MVKDSKDDKMTQEKTPVEKGIEYCKWCKEEIKQEYQECCFLRLVLNNFTGEFCSFDKIEKEYKIRLQLSAKAERDKTAKEIEKLIMKMDMDIACDKARFFESKYIAHYERLLRILKQKYGCKDK